MAAVLSEKKLIQLARGEKIFLDFGTEQDIVQGTFYSPVSYAMKLEDLVSALKNFKKKRLTMQEFGYWYYPLSRHEEMFGLTWMYRKEINLKDWEKLLKNQYSVFYYIWNALDETWTDPQIKEQGLLENAVDLPSLIELGENCLANHGKTLSKCAYTKTLKEHAIDSWALQGNRPKPWQLRLAKQFTDELSKEDSIPALRNKAFACEFGTNLYKQDYSESLRCFEKLYSLTQESKYAAEAGILAKKLGQYQEAFSYLSIAHVEGWYRASLNLGILLVQGKGCPKSSLVGGKLLKDIYDQMADRFVQGTRQVYLETAAYTLAEGIRFLPYSERQKQDCYTFMLLSSFVTEWKYRYGYPDAIVTETAEKVTDAVRIAQAKLPESFFRSDTVFPQPYLLNNLAAEETECYAEVLEKKDRVILHAWRPYGEKELLIPLPEQADCFFNRHVVYQLPKAGRWQLAHRKITFNQTEWNTTLCRQEFYEDQKLTGWVEADEFTLLNCHPLTVQGPLVDLVIVSTDTGEVRGVAVDPGIMPQIKVIITDKRGRKEQGIVKDVFRCYQSELTGLEEKYTVRKA